MRRRDSSRQLDEDLAALDRHGEAGHACGGVVGVGAGGHVPPPTMPRTHDDGAVDVALAQRAAAVRTTVVEGVYRPRDIEYRQRPPVDLEHPRLADRHV